MIWTAAQASSAAVAEHTYGAAFFHDIDIGISTSVFRATMTSTDDQRVIALLGSVRKVDQTAQKRGQATAGDGPDRKRAKCEHGRQRSTCKACGGRGICSHGRVKGKCKECGGAGSICVHGRRY